MRVKICRRRRHMMTGRSQVSERCLYRIEGFGWSGLSFEIG